MILIVNTGKCSFAIFPDFPYQILFHLTSLKKVSEELNHKIKLHFRHMGLSLCYFSGRLTQALQL